MKYKAVIFDLDGTLLDTIRDLAESMNEVLTRYSLPTYPVDDYKTFVGEGMEVLVRRVLPEGCANQETIVACLQAMRKEYEMRWARNSRPYEGVPDLLDGLVARGLKVSVLSNKPDDFTKLMVAELLPRWRFDPVLGARTGVPVKPDPAGAQEIAERLCLSTGEFLYLGDTGVDMQTANAAGMHAVGALWGFRAAEELLLAGAKTLLEKPVDLLELVS